MEIPVMRTSIQIIEIFKGSNFLKSLTPAMQKHLFSLFTPRTFVRSETIFLQGEAGNTLYLIKSGKVKICTVDPNGVELVYCLLTVGELLGEMAIFDGGPRSATAIAVDNTEMLCLERCDFLDVLRSSPDACIDIISLLCRRLRDTDTLIEEVAFMDASARLARKLLGDSQTASTCISSQEDLARALRVSRITINKILKSYAAAGWITISRRKITLLNPNELRRIARHASI
jgi:CRP/FNR family transcriptional regulator, cyclic AMP receptor protein